MEEDSGERDEGERLDMGSPDRFALTEIRICDRFIQFVNHSRITVSVITYIPNSIAGVHCQGIKSKN